MDFNGLLLPFCFIGLYFVLEAADWGLSVAAPYVCRNEEESKALLGLFKPGWDGHELWLLLGVLSLEAALSQAGSSWKGMALLGTAGLGALFRLIGCFAKGSMARPIFIKGMSLFSIFALFVMSLVISSFLHTEGAMVSALGIFFAIWMILAAFQMGTLYGACKVVNPLGERCRAAFLVSGIVGLVLHLISVGLLYINAGDVYQYGYLLWIALGMDVLLFLSAFALTRMRQALAGLIAFHLSLISGMCLYMSAASSVTTVTQVVDISSGMAFFSGMENTALLVGAVVLSLAALGYRLLRKKEEYVWDDHV